MNKLPDYSDKRFLIVDDEVFMLGMIERMLKQCNARSIAKADNGAAALKAISDNFSQVDCIISDCNMEPVNGLQLLQAVRTGANSKIPREQPFIMLTGHGETDMVQSAIKLDVHGYVVKPVALDKLVKTIDRAMGKRIDLKGEHYYRDVKLPKVESVYEAETNAPIAWVLLPRSSPYRSNIGLRENIKTFQQAHTNRGGDEPVKIKNRRACEISQLVEGQILAQNIEAEEGSVLLYRGVSLDRGMIDRLRQLAFEAQSNQAIWVGELDE